MWADFFSGIGYGGRLIYSAEASGFTLRLEQSEDVTLADGTLDIADEGTLVGVHELDLNLGDATAGAGFANDFLNGGVHNFTRVHDFF